MSNEFFGQNLPVENGKSEQHHWILHIRISLGTKFQIKPTIFIFWIEFTPIMVFPVENKKGELHY